MKNPASHRFRHDVMAIIYDFDGTLTPLPMQEYTVLPMLGIPAKRFWKEVDGEIRRTRGDAMLTYMRVLLESLRRHGSRLTRNDLAALAANIRYFPGVEGWFERIDSYVRERAGTKVKLRHYVISSGLAEILEGASIRKAFHRIFASEYFYDEDGAAVFPKVAINDTVKTQYLFRINKGKEDHHQSINEYMPEEGRAIPFPNMIYIGDGLTDVPCMTVAKKNGGHAVAVYRPHDRKSIGICRDLMQAGRVDFLSAADYRAGRSLDRRVKLLLDKIIADILCRREAFSCTRV